VGWIYLARFGVPITVIKKLTILRNATVCVSGRNTNLFEEAAGTETSLRFYLYLSD